MVVLADPLLESIFKTDPPQLFWPLHVEDLLAPKQVQGGLLENVGGFLSGFVIFSFIFLLDTPRIGVQCIVSELI